MFSTQKKTWQTQRGVIHSLLPYLWPADQPRLRARVACALSLLFIAKLADACIPWVYKAAVDALGRGQSVAVPIGLIASYGGTRVISLIFTELRDCVFSRVGQSAIQTISVKLFNHLHALSLRFHLSKRTGGLNRSIERGVKGIETLLNYLLFHIIPTIFEIGLVVVILWHFCDKWLALTTLLTATIYIAFTLFLTEWRTHQRRIMNKMDSQANSLAVDSLLNYETVKYFGNETHEADRYALTLGRYADAAVKDQYNLSLLNIGQAVIISSGLTAVMWQVAIGIVAARYTLGDFVLVNAYLLQLYQPLNYFGYVYREIKQALVNMESMFELLSLKPEIADHVGAYPLVTQNCRVEFCDVSFSYDSRRPVLKNVSFTIEPGQTLAIIGASGSGKSTIGRLLLRFYTVDQGTISIDGVNLESFTQESLRQAIGVVPQECILFNDTLLYNIAYSKPSATQAQVQTAAQLAHVHSFIDSLPEGYDSIVGERGLKLSGGEKQRIGIARAILKAPALFLLDEATSALDTHTEKEIQLNLRELSRGRTTLIIAHRLSTIVHANEILVLHQGKVVERGRHLDLLGLRGRYFQMWNQQELQQPSCD